MHPARTPQFVARKRLDADRHAAEAQVKRAPEQILRGRLGVDLDGGFGQTG
jgi:hypothetical protein